MAGSVSSSKNVFASQTVFLTVNLEIPESILNKIQSIINNFIWNTRNLECGLVSWTKRPLEDGVAIPNIRKYYHTFIRVTCIDWWQLSETGLVPILQHGRMSCGICGLDDSG